MLRIKDRLLEEARMKAVPRTHINIQTVNDILNILYKNCSKDQKERKKKLDEIDEIDDASVKVDKLFEFLMEDIQSEKSQNSRLSQQLTGCVYLFELIYNDSLKALKDSYLKKKYIEITTDGGEKIRTEVNTGETPAKKAIDELVKKYHVVDMTIENPPMEEIIKEIYKRD